MKPLPRYTPARVSPGSPKRRVYTLPVELVARIHRYGHEHGHPSEVSAVRELLESALRNHEASTPSAQIAEG